jgi:hypothetical protein
MTVEWPKRKTIMLWIAVAAVIAAAVMRYAQQPSFWLDEAFVAVAVRNRSVSGLFSVLDYSQYFPRLYLTGIVLLRQVAGYHVWNLRLLPLLSFVAATLFWARLLHKRSQSFFLLGVMSALLLLGASLWLNEATQLKQYTFDVMLALIPFLLGDDILTKSLVDGQDKMTLIALAAGCLLSYTYPFALGARILGWYLWRGARIGWLVNLPAGAMLAASVMLALIGIWLTDYRFNLIDRNAYLAYWNDCILSSAFRQGIGKGMRLVVKFLWGWHGREPLVTAGMAPLQLLGGYAILKRWRASADTATDPWGSRSLGSLVLLLGMILASLSLGYPICAGRVTLFVQIHMQILALEGALFLLLFSKRHQLARAAVACFLVILAIHSVRDYLRFVRAEAPENIRPMLSLIKPEIANTLWVHSCSIAQVRSLPDPLPIQDVQLGPQGLPPHGRRVWVLWTHLGAEYCRNELEQLRSQSRNWQVVHEGPDRGLALAEF